MKKYRLFLIDLDGTIYRGKDTIESGVRFVKRLEEAGLDYLFLTNNTTRTPQMVADKLKGHGVETSVDKIYTPSMATASYILEKEKKRPVGVYIIGQIGLWKELLDRPEFYYDEEHPDYVVVGMDTDLTYHKLMVATRCIQRGAVFIGTNSDQNLPVGGELRPGNGAICAALTVASGKQPVFIGKPEAIIVNRALDLAKAAASEALIVGDNYPTDIMAGINSGVDTLLTLTGVTRKEDLAGLTPPTYLVNDLDEFSL
ncbi:haloacid dehalogenase [Lactobacillus nasalidis]|uniref:Acid sugar phosphatase n=1 Tax=Lactobacillus nasalidis TaxID=2797258 RepID=A0ABQ3W917_9LACO|nr:TIGR01457 family HAD-type hydrolase [Lactobacillus nasalidis]GHV97235.1 haloacid dehalogenase [Lactobacillus nasalidis]GHV99729.1 haloacid dehalogenase [Lactobacillus nasalidis]GHW01915.1 haloacid dehalogenase [Lactobacillus nasalidis]